jgi:hypothetical protein
VNGAGREFDFGDGIGSRISLAEVRMAHYPDDGWSLHSNRRIHVPRKPDILTCYNVASETLSRTAAGTAALLSEF